jgi:hypothetical protein
MTDMYFCINQTFALAAHGTDLGHHFKFCDAQILGSIHISGYTGRITKQAIKLRFPPDNFNCFDNPSLEKFSTDNRSCAISWRFCNRNDTLSCCMEYMFSKFNAKVKFSLTVPRKHIGGV